MTANSGGALGGKVALVTGAERNIGEAVARRLAREGATVVVNGLDAEAVDRVVTAIGDDGGSARPGRADLSEPGEVHALFDDIERNGGLDVVVNNAAMISVGVPFLDLDLAVWDRCMAVNARGLFLVSLLGARLMAAGGGGSIVHISSLGASRAHRNNVPYDASKGLVEAATRSMALDLAPQGIRVNAVAPGSIHNHLTAALPPDTLAERAAVVPLGRLGQGADVAAAVAFLCSEDGGYVTGQVLHVDGGLGVQLRPPAR